MKKTIALLMVSLLATAQAADATRDRCARLGSALYTGDILKPLAPPATRDLLPGTMFDVVQ
jgi:hypothetical protein